jgi:hypothetical protein
MLMKLGSRIQTTESKLLLENYLLDQEKMSVSA